jgi:hypothetical protein
MTGAGDGTTPLLLGPLWLRVVGRGKQSQVLRAVRELELTVWRLMAGLDHVEVAQAIDPLLELAVRRRRQHVTAP